MKLDIAEPLFEQSLILPVILRDACEDVSVVACEYRGTEAGCEDRKGVRNCREGRCLARVATERTLHELEACRPTADTAKRESRLLRCD